MVRFALPTVALAAGLAVAGTSGAGASTKPAAPSFSREVLPTLQRRCVACHITGSEPGQLSLVPRQAYAQLVGRRSVQSALMRVERGNPARSYMMHKLRGTQASVKGAGLKMPIGAPLDDASMAKIERWIRAGAPNN